jgi:hypothetical protein
MNSFKVFGSNAPTYGTSSTVITAKEKAAEAKAAKIAAAEKARKDAEDLAAQRARDSANVKAGLVQINATHGLEYDPNTRTYKGGKRKRHTRRSRKNKTKRRKTRRRR